MIRRGSLPAGAVALALLAVGYGREVVLVVLVAVVLYAALGDAEPL